MKMNKIVAGVSAAALAVSALATSAFAGGPYTYVTQKDVADTYKVALSQEVSAVKVTAAAGTNTIAETIGVAGQSENKIAIVNKLTGSKLKDIILNGSIKVSQTVKAQSMTASGSPEDTVTFSGSVDLKDFSVPGSTDSGKETDKLTIGGGSKLLDQAAVVKEDTTAKAEANITLTLSAADFKKLLTTGDDVDYTKLYDDNGLPKSDTKESIARGLVKTVANGIVISPFGVKEFDTATSAGALDVADTVKFGNVWTVKEVEITTKKSNHVLAETNGVGDVTGGSALDVLFKNTFNFDALKDMSNGGTVTVKFSKAPATGKQYSVNVSFYNTSLALAATNSYAVTSDTLVFDMPADFSGTLSGIYGEPQMIIDATDWNMKDNKVEIISVTLTPKDGADVSAATTTAAAATTTAPKTNEGDTNSNKPSTGDKNQPTGVALAIVPAIVAAAGVVISKKRK